MGKRKRDDDNIDLKIKVHEARGEYLKVLKLTRPVEGESPEDRKVRLENAYKGFNKIFNEYNGIELFADFLCNLYYNHARVCAQLGDKDDEGKKCAKKLLELTQGHPKLVLKPLKLLIYFDKKNSCNEDLLGHFYKKNGVLCKVLSQFKTEQRKLKFEETQEFGQYSKNIFDCEIMIFNNCGDIINTQKELNPSANVERIVIKMYDLSKTISTKISDDQLHMAQISKVQLEKEKVNKITKEILSKLKNSSLKALKDSENPFPESPLFKVVKSLNKLHKWSISSDEDNLIEEYWDLLTAMEKDPAKNTDDNQAKLNDLLKHIFNPEGSNPSYQDTLIEEYSKLVEAMESPENNTVDNVAKLNGLIEDIFDTMNQSQ